MRAHCQGLRLRQVFFCSKHLQCIFVDREFKKGKGEIKVVSITPIFNKNFHVPIQSSEAMILKVLRNS